MEEKIKTIEKLSRDLLSRLGLSAQAKAVSDGQTVLLKVELDEPGILIGKSGETLAEFQYLLRLLTNRKLGEFTYLTVDVNDYQQRQQEQTEQQVIRAMRIVKRTSGSQLLEPMSASLRKIVHLKITDEADLETQSVGEEPNRRVLIKVKQVD